MTYTQKFEGAAAGLLNANLISQELGLADRQELTGKDGAPFEVRDVSLIETARRLAFILTAATHEQRQITKPKGNSMTKPQISKSNVATIEGLEKRRVKQEGIIATPRAAHAQSVIEGAEFDSGPIRVAEDELTAIITAQETLHELELEYGRQEAENQAKLTDHENASG